MRRLSIRGGFEDVVPLMEQRSAEVRTEGGKERPASLPPLDANADVPRQVYHTKILRLRSSKRALDYLQLTRGVAD